MNQYIKKDKVLSLLGLDHNDYVYIDKRELAKKIEKLKGIDIVRCKECEHNESSWCPMRMFPSNQDFCSYGEYKESKR